MPRPSNIEMLGADPMFQAYQKSGVWQKVKPKRNRFVGAAVFLSILVLCGLLITGLTNANWLLCVPIFLVMLVILSYLFYKDWKAMRP